MTLKMTELKKMEMMLEDYSKDYLDTLDEVFVKGLTLRNTDDNGDIIEIDFPLGVLDNLDGQLDSVGNYY